MDKFQVIFVRHGVKEYENGRVLRIGAPVFDPPLINYDYLDDTVEILRKFRIMKIYSSPLLRCRQTAEYIATKLKLFRPILYLVRIREYLGNWITRKNGFPENLHFDPETVRIFDLFLRQCQMREGIPIFENNFKAFEDRRIRPFCDELIRGNYNGTCLITHSVVIETICKKLGAPIEKNCLNPGAVIRLYREDGKFYSEVILPEKKEEPKIEYWGDDDIHPTTVADVLHPTTGADEYHPTTGADEGEEQPTEEELVNSKFLKLINDIKLS